MRIVKSNRILFLILIIVFSNCRNEQKVSNVNTRFISPISFEKASERALLLLDKMTVEEKIDLLGGEFRFFTHAHSHLAIPHIFMVDATQGIRLDKNVKESDFVVPLERTTAFPSPILLASTWNVGLAEAYAKSIGEECRAAGAGVLLGPGMNIYRISQCGRDFEYFGEDPFLVSRMIERYVVGVQNTGTMATLKHFVANNTEFYRRRSNSIVDERALHEIYLPGFKAGIDAGAMAVMTSYNKLNGEWCGQSAYVINDLLRSELGFKWLVMTDWTSVWNAEKLVASGQDLEMPKRIVLANLKEKLDSGKVTIQQIDRMVISSLSTFISMGFLDRPQRDSTFLRTFEEHEKLALKVAREGIVLLKNDNNTLPISVEGNGKIVVTGKYVDSLAAGGGAAAVTGYNNVMLFDALKVKFGNRVEKVAIEEEQKIAKASMVIVSVGTFDRESADRPFDLPTQEEQAVLKVLELNKNSVVIVNSGAGINMSHWIDKTPAIVYAWYGGQTGNTALAEILAGEVNPSGKLPITIEKDFKDSPGYGYLPVDEVLYKAGSDTDKFTHREYDVHYNEGIFVGYRWYENKNIQPLFAFGSGLSFSTFEYSRLSVSPLQFSISDPVIVTFNLKNTSERVGSEIAQLYIQDEECSQPRPVKELKGFKKVLLAAGVEKQVSIQLNASDFSFWDPVSKAWKTEPGKFKILVGPSSDKIALEAGVILK